MKSTLIIFLLISVGVFAQTPKKSNENILIANKQIFENLKSGDTVVLNYAMTGCFSLTVEKMIFTKTDNVIKAAIYDKDKLIKSHIISAEHFKYLLSFEEKARSMNRNTGCTNSESYTFLRNNKPQYKIMDSTCSWNGYSLLKKVIFNISII